MIETCERMPRDGEVLKREGELEGLAGSNLCFRCGRDPDKAHDSGFCPAFAWTSDCGHWLSFAAIRRALERHSPYPLSAWTTNRVEDPEGPYGTYHVVVGLGANGRYVGRLNHPYVPEFSLWHGAEDEYGLPTGRTHSMLLMGWRRNLREICSRIGAPSRKVARDLGITLDRTTEEIRRFKASYL